MLVTNQRLDKLAAARVDFQARGMLKSPLFGEVNVPQTGPPTHLDDDDDEGAVDDDILGEVILSQKPRKSLLLNITYTFKHILQFLIYHAMPHNLENTSRYQISTNSYHTSSTNRIILMTTYLWTTFLLISFQL